nr:uncharacterized mitochondrial protein AtMg00810-like [Tanacetum cinerariifolium]
MTLKKNTKQDLFYQNLKYSSKSVIKGSVVQKQLITEVYKIFEAKYNKVKAKLALLSSSASSPKSSLRKNKGLIDETYEWDEEEVSSDKNEAIEVKALMALANEERVFVSKESSNNDNSEVSITGSNKPKLSEAEDSTMLNHDTGKIKQSERGISINQEKYVKDLLKKYDINGSSIKTLMVPPNNLGPDLNGKSINETQFIGMIGTLMYLPTNRPDIQFLTYLYARYQAKPMECHLITVKRIFRYLKGTPCLGLWYPKCLGFDLKGYSLNMLDATWTKKSTSGSCQLLGGKLVCWSAKKQQYVAISSVEAEYVAAAGCCANILWMKC